MDEFIYLMALYLFLINSQDFLCPDLSSILFILNDSVCFDFMYLQNVWMGNWFFLNIVIIFLMQNGCTMIWRKLTTHTHSAFGTKSLPYHIYTNKPLRGVAIYGLETIFLSKYKKTKANFVDLSTFFPVKS